MLRQELYLTRLKYIMCIILLYIYFEKYIFDFTYFKRKRNQVGRISKERNYIIGSL